MIELLHSETFWVAIAFVIFVGLSFNKGKKIILDSLDKKISEITKNINDAEKIKSDANNNLKEAENKLNKIRLEKKQIIEDAKKESQQIKEKILEQDIKDKKRMEDQINDRIDQYKNEALKEIKNETIELSISSIKNLLVLEKKDQFDAGLITSSVIDILKDKTKKNKRL